MSETPKDYARILSIPYMVNFDQIFITAYPLKEATLSSIELIKQEIAEKFERSDRKYSQSDLSKGDLGKGFTWVDLGDFFISLEKKRHEDSEATIFKVPGVKLRNAKSTFTVNLQW